MNVCRIMYTKSINLNMHQPKRIPTHLTLIGENAISLRRHDQIDPLANRSCLRGTTSTHEPRNHPTVIVRLYAPTQAFQNITLAPRVSQQHCPWNRRHLGINATAQRILGWCPLAAPPLEPTTGVVSTRSPATWVP